jgi:hypothetical protein
MSARTARRRRVQMANNFRHLAKLGRPIYPGRVSAETSQRREMAYRERLKKIHARKRKK